MMHTDWTFGCNAYEEIRELLPATLTSAWGSRPDWSCAYVADDTRLTGLCIFSTDNKNGVLHIHYLFITPDCRRKNLGTDLLAYTFRQAGAARLARILMNRPDGPDARDAFLRKAGFTPQELNGSIYHVSRTEWTDKALPRINALGRRAGNFSYVTWQEMNAEEKQRWTEMSDSDEVFVNLRPGRYDTDSYQRLFFHDDTGKPVGWVVISLKNSVTVSLDVIYVLPEWRGGGTVFALYAMATEFACRTWPQINGLHFQLDTGDTSLVRFYHRLLRDARFTCHKMYSYEIPLVPAIGQ